MTRRRRPWPWSSSAVAISWTFSAARFVIEIIEKRLLPKCDARIPTPSRFCQVPLSAKAAARLRSRRAGESRRRRAGEILGARRRTWLKIAGAVVRVHAIAERAVGLPFEAGVGVAPPGGLIVVGLVRDRPALAAECA